MVSWMIYTFLTLVGFILVFLSGLVEIPVGITLFLISVTLYYLWSYLWPYISIVFNDYIIPVWNWLVPYIQLLWDNREIISEEITLLLFNIFWLFLTALTALLTAIMTWLNSNIYLIADAPVRYYYNLGQATTANPFTGLFACNNLSKNLFCYMTEGMVTMDMMIGSTVLYPVIIILILMGTVTIFKNELL